MTGEQIGYTHSMFSNNLRAVAVKFDKKENGGNNNGLIDGNEISLFTTYVKEHYKYDFDFEKLGLKQSTLLTVDNTSPNNKLSTDDAALELAEKHRANGMNSLIAKYLNRENGFKGDKVNIAYLSDEDMKTCEAITKKVEDEISKNIDKEKNPQKNETKPNDNLDRGIFRLIDWIFG